MKIENRPFTIYSPTETITINIPMEWDGEIGEWLMTVEGIRMVNEVKLKKRGMDVDLENIKDYIISAPDYVKRSLERIEAKLHE